METYAILEDLVTRFESITWPVLRLGADVIQVTS